MHIISQNRDGVDAETLTPVLDAIKELGNKDVTEHIEKMGDRKFDPDLLFGPAICAETCQKNQAIQA